MKKNAKVKLVEILIIKAFHMNLAPGFQSLSSHIVQFHLIINYKTPTAYIFMTLNSFVFNKMNIK